jgi:hypothetical protein
LVGSDSSSLSSSHSDRARFRLCILFGAFHRSLPVNWIASSRRVRPLICCLPSCNAILTCSRAGRPNWIRNRSRNRSIIELT